MRRSKYNAIPTTVDGIRFDSKKEAAYYMDLKLRVASGETKYFLRQINFDLPGGVKYRVDFLRVDADDHPHWVDVKGVKTAMYKLKKKQVEVLYPIKLEEV